MQARVDEREWRMRATFQAREATEFDVIDADILDWILLRSRPSFRIGMACRRQSALIAGRGAFRAPGLRFAAPVPEVSGACDESRCCRSRAVFASRAWRSTAMID